MKLHLEELFTGNIGTNGVSRGFVLSVTININHFVMCPVAMIGPNKKFKLLLLDNDKTKKNRGF